MNRDFRNRVELLDRLYRQLLAMPPVRIHRLPRAMPLAGIYLLSEGSKHLYVGRTNRLRARLQEHGRPSATHNSAPFAFTLARKATGYRTASYTAQGSRAQLEKEPRFRRAFTRAKARIGRMDIRFVEEADPTRQALLELYVAIALHTPYNDFNTH